MTMVRKKMMIETGSHLTEEEEEESRYSELEAGPSANPNRGESNKPQDYPEGAYTQPSWRPPMPIEYGIWKPIHVKTNGEGRERLLYADPLVEVYDVKVDLCGKTSGNIHGKIILDCTGYEIYLFNHDKENELMIHKKGSFTLIGPDIAPMGYDPVTIVVDLNIYDDKLCTDIVEWDTSYYPTNEWLYSEVKGRNGSVQVTYLVMKAAWLAEVDVKLIRLTEDPIGSRIHGDIIVYINDMPYLRYFIFSKRSGDSSTIKPLESIPLSRSLFCCPHGSSLFVKVDLWNSDTNEPLVRGALLFPPEYYGDSVGKLSSRYGEIQVNVNWAEHSKHSKTCAALRWTSLY